MKTLTKKERGQLLSEVPSFRNHLESLDLDKCEDILKSATPEQLAQLAGMLKHPDMAMLMQALLAPK